MKNYKRLQMEVISLNNEDVLTASGIQDIDPSKDPNGYCINNSHGIVDFGNCVSACYGILGHNQKVCDWYKGGKQGEYPGRW